VAAPALAAAPDLTIGTPTDPTYTTVHVEGSVDAHGEPTGWGYEVSDDGGASWQGTNLGNFTESDGPEAADGEIEGLTAGKTYQVRLAATNYNDGSQGFSPGPDPEFTTDPVPAPTVTIDPVGGVTGTSAHLGGRIEPNPPAGDPSAADVEWHFECSPECPNLPGGTVPAAATGAEQEVGVEASELEPNTEYSVTLVGKNAGEPIEAGPVTFTTAAVDPDVQTLPAFAVRGGTEALVGGSIDPRNSATTYWIEWGRTTGYGQKVPATPADAGSGNQLEYFTRRLTGLTPSTVYHVRLVAESDGHRSDGADVNFETAPSSEAIEQDCPNATLRLEDNSTALPECRAYEQVSPVDKNGFDVAQFPPGGGDESFLAAKDGSKLAFLSTGAFGDSKSAFLSNPYLSSRGPGGWTTHALGPPAFTPEVQLSKSLIDWFTPDLSQAVIMPVTGYHLAPGDFPGDLNLYVENTATGALATVSNGTFSPGRGGYFVLGGSDDGRVVYFVAGRLLENAPSSNSSIYEWRDGNLKLASLLPDGEPVQSGATIVAPSGTNYVSPDGSRVFFEDGEGNLYLREDQHTYEIVGPAPGAVPRFLGATPDLSGIFFRSSLALTPGAAEDGTAKLYRYNSGSKTITQISPNAPNGGNVTSVRGVSPDGSYVYFRSEARYLPGQGVRGRDGTVNLYMWHDGEIALIGTEPSAQLSGEGSDEAKYTKFRVSPDGKFASFESPDRLTAYDNTDATPGPGGASRADSEIYVFDAETKRLTCVSCNPSGEPPSGTAEGADAGASVPNQPIFSSNQQAGVGDDGHIFFNSRDALVPADVNGVQDVYEWRDGQVHLISTGTGNDPAAYADSGSNGDDAFFSTRQQLTSSDRDGLVDLYDARVDGGFPRSAEASLCEGLDSCHGPESRSPAESALGSPGTAPESRADSRRLRLNRALKQCKHRPKKQRARCRAKVKKRFKHSSTGRTH